MAVPVTKYTIIHRCINAEGGYVNDPDDPGGATRYGVTEKVARANGYRGDMRNFPMEDAIDIYADHYWKPLELDSVFEHAPEATEILFNWGVNAGTHRAGKAFQCILNAFNYENRYGLPLAEDGRPGLKTLTMFRAFYKHRGKTGAEVLAGSLLASRITFYLELAKSPVRKKYAFGWIKRTLEEAAYGHTGA